MILAYFFSVAVRSERVVVADTGNARVVRILTQYRLYLPYCWKAE